MRDLKPVLVKTTYYFYIIIEINVLALDYSLFHVHRCCGSRKTHHFPKESKSRWSAPVCFPLLCIRRESSSVCISMEEIGPNDFQTALENGLYLGF